MDSAHTESTESQETTKHYAKDEDTKTSINRGSKRGRQGFSVKIWKKFNKLIGRRGPVTESHLNESTTKKEEFPSLLDQTTRKEIMELANQQLEDEFEENTPFSISLWI